MRRAGLVDPRDMTIALIGRSQVARPNTKGETTYMELLPPLLNRDTKAKEDGIGIRDGCDRGLVAGDAFAAQLLQQALPQALASSMQPVLLSQLPCKVKIMRFDGQGVITCANCMYE